MNNTDLKTILDKIQSLENRMATLERSGGAMISKSKAFPTSKSTQESLTVNIVNKTGDCEESEQIRKNVLDVRSQEAKVLLCFFITYKYFSNSWLNSGDIEQITSELGIRIDKRNATNKLKEIRQYLESGSARKKGQATPYRLNRKGANRFEEILKDK